MLFGIFSIFGMENQEEIMTIKDLAENMRRLNENSDQNKIDIMTLSRDLNQRLDRIVPIVQRLEAGRELHVQPLNANRANTGPGIGTCLIGFGIGFFAKDIGRLLYTSPGHIAFICFMIALFVRR